jgi:hypothetical protein
MTDLNDIFEEEADRIRKQAEADDNNAALVAARKAKRDAEVQREIRLGVRDADGDLILGEDTDEDDEDEDDPEA